MIDQSIELTCIEQVEAIDEDGFRFWGDGSEQYILKDGVIRRQAYKHILSSKPFAEEYLNLIRNNRVDLDWQTQHLIILDKLYGLIRGGRWDFRDLAPLFYEAMTVLAQKSAQALEVIQNRDEIEEAVQAGYQIYEFNGLTTSAVAHARRAAVQGMIRKFAEQYGAEGGYKGDLYGSYSFELTKPRIDSVIPWLAREYHEDNKPSARIRQHNEGTWSLEFFHLIPFNEGDRLALAVETYKAAIPVLEHALEMNATVYWELSD